MPKSSALDYTYKGFDYTVCLYDLEMSFPSKLIPSKWYCGYVFLPKGNLFYDKHYDTIEGISAHGGLTYSGKFHVKESKNFEKYAIGFDMNHYNDNGGSLLQAVNECKSIIDQLLKRNIK